MRAVRLLGLSGLAFLAACGREDALDPTGPIEPDLEIAPIRAVDGYRDLGGPVTALAVMPSASSPTVGRGLASVEGVGFVLLDLFEGASEAVEAPHATSLAVAPEFSLRGAAAPLIIAAGGGHETPGVYIYLAADETIIPAPAQPIDSAFDIDRLCVTRATNALIEFIAVGATEARRWRVRDEGEELLVSQDLGAEPDMAGAQACTLGPNDELVALDAAGRLTPEGPSREASDIAVTAIELDRYALLARPGAGHIAAVNRSDGRLIARFSIEDALNAPGSPTPRDMALSAESFGGSAYRGGVLMVTDGDTVSVVSLEQLLGAITTPSASG